MDPDELARRARELLVDDAASRRARQASHRAVADDLTTTAALLLAAARRRHEVGLTLLGGGQVRLVPRLVGPDVLAGARPGSPTDVVALGALASVELPTGAETDLEADVTGPTLRDVIDAVLDERPPVAAWTIDGGGPHSGELVGCGQDVIVVRTANGSRRALPLASLGRLRLAP
ncbi:MAG: hypothetical protein AAGA17_10140 [Actinomycetota bacterium]